MARRESVALDSCHCVRTWALATDLERLRDTFTDVPEATIVRALTAWAAIYGT